MKVMDSGWLAAGKKTEEFEQKFAKYVGVKYAIFTNSGTAALKMAYKYFIQEVDNQLFWGPENTFCATYSACEEVGGRYWKSIEKPNDYAFTVNVHYGGVKDRKKCEIEDSAHRIEKNDPLVGKIRIYSFYVTKNMTTGAGGMLVTNDKKIYDKCRLYWMDGINKSSYARQHGGWDYEVKAMAGGYDGNDIAAAIGLEQLKKLPMFTKKRNRIRDIYNTAFEQDWQGNHLYPYFVKRKIDIGGMIDWLRQNDIQASYHYPNTEWMGVSLPIYPDLTDKEVARICLAVKTYHSLTGFS